MRRDAKWRERAAAAHARYLDRCAREAEAEKRRLEKIRREIDEGKHPLTDDALEFVILAIIAAMWLYLAFGGAAG